VQRFFVNGAALAGDTVAVEGPQARQIALVLRMRAGDEVTLCGGEGTEVLCRLTSVTPRCVTMQVVRRTANATEAALQIHLYPALVRAPRFELVLQKATELGVAAITPVLCRRSIARPSGDEVPQRWRSIVREAVEQSGRGRLPELAAVVDFPAACSEAARADLALCCSEHGGEALRDLIVLPVANTLAIITGPEGGLELEEVAEARRRGLHAVTLGPRILRAETAAIAVCAAALCLAGDWG
jgi:16S rRNA (uracil1498-N3)-methyltransferase